MTPATKARLEPDPTVMLLTVSVATPLTDVIAAVLASKATATGLPYGGNEIRQRSLKTAGLGAREAARCPRTIGVERMGLEKPARRRKVGHHPCNNGLRRTDGGVAVGRKRRRIALAGRIGVETGNSLPYRQRVDGARCLIEQPEHEIGIYRSRLHRRQGVLRLSFPASRVAANQRKRVAGKQYVGRLDRHFLASWNVRGAISISRLGWIVVDGTVGRIVWRPRVAVGVEERGLAGKVHRLRHRKRRGRRVPFLRVRHEVIVAVADERRQRLRVGVLLPPQAVIPHEPYSSRPPIVDAAVEAGAVAAAAVAGHAGRGVVPTDHVAGEAEH